MIGSLRVPLRSIAVAMSLGLLSITGSVALTGCSESVTSANQPVFISNPVQVVFPSTPGTRQQNVNITNEGKATLVVSKMEIIGADRAMFGFASGSEPFDLATFDGSPQTRRKVEVTFTRPEGDTAGHEAVLRIETNQSIQSGKSFDGVFEIALKAPASNGRLFATPNPIIFGRVAPPNCVEVVPPSELRLISQMPLPLTFLKTAASVLPSPSKSTAYRAQEVGMNWGRPMAPA